MPTPAEPAATVILLRQGAISPETLLLERHARSQALPDLYVFPGGRVEEQDHHLAGQLQGLSTGELEAQLPHISPEQARAFAVAAIRETFEESAILLARRRGSRDWLGSAELEPLLAERLELQSGAIRFEDLIQREELELAGDALSIHAHWITPEFMKLRYDTVFFCAIAPPDQLAAHDGVETSGHIWIRPEDALEQRRLGERQIIFPTARNLETLVGFEQAEAALEASRQRPVVPVLPELVERDGERKLVIPPAAGYPTREDVL